MGVTVQPIGALDSSKISVRMADPNQLDPIEPVAVSLEGAAIRHLLALQDNQRVVGVSNDGTVVVAEDANEDDILVFEVTIKRRRVDQETFMRQLCRSQSSWVAVGTMLKEGQ